MLEFGFNRTDYGKTVLAACFINDLATVLALGFMFSPFTLKTLIFAGGARVSSLVLPWLTPRFFKRYGDRPSELEAKFLLLCMFGLGALACGPTASRCCRPTSWAWFWPARWARTTRWSGGCAR